MITCRSSDVGKQFQIEKHTGRLSCLVQKWPLSTGSYTYNIYTATRHEVLDWIRGAGVVEVESGDFYGTGKKPSSGVPTVYINYDWLAD